MRKYLLNPQIINLIGSGRLKSQDIVEHSLQLLATNPLIYDCFDMNILEATQLKLIAINPSSEKMENPDKDLLKKIGVEPLKKILKSFLNLSSNHLLTDVDLTIIFDHLHEISIDVDRDNFSLMNYPFIKEKCTQSIHHRLTRLLLERPIILVNGTYDSFVKLIKDCKDAGADFTTVRDTVIETSIQNKLAEIGIDQFNSILQLHNDLEVSLISLWAGYFYERYFGLIKNSPYDIEDDDDTFELIDLHINEKCIESKIEINDMRAAVMRTLLQRIKSDSLFVIDKMEDMKLKVPKIYKKIVEIIQNSEKQLAANEEKSDQPFFEKVMLQVINLAQEEKNKLTSPSLFKSQALSANQKPESKFKYYPSTNVVLFTDELSKTTKLRIDYCDQLLRLSELKAENINAHSFAV